MSKHFATVLPLPQTPIGSCIKGFLPLVLFGVLMGAACSRRGQTVNAPAGDSSERVDVVTGRSGSGACKAGYVTVGTACVSEEGPCAFIDCSGHGTCGVSRGEAVCTCDAGFHASALECLPDRRECLTRPLDQFSAFPTKNHQPAGTWVESECVRVTGVSKPLPLSMAYDRGEVSVNGGDWSKSAVLRDGDTVRLRGEAHVDADGGNTIYLLHEKDIYGIFEYRTANTDRAPRVWQVGPTREFKQLDEVSQQLRAGDVIELDGGATYAPVQFTRAGTPELPIRLRGSLVLGKRPVISGGSVALGFRRGHHYVVENVEVTGAGETCLRAEADGLRFIDVFVHDCPRHGVLGADTGSGTVVFDRGEIARCGGELEGESLKHGLYVATDYQSYPGSKLKVVHSFLHDNGGNAIKSRAERTEVYFDWLENRDAPGSYYALELIGFQEFQEHGPQHSDVVGNVIVGANAYAMRIGGDGSGESRGRVRLVNNTFLLGPQFAEQAAPVLRVTGGLDALWLANNAFVGIGRPGAPLRVWRHDQATWASGQLRAGGVANWLPEASPEELDYIPGNLTQTRRDATDPGFVSVTSWAALDTSLTEHSTLRGAGASSPPGAGFEVDDGLTELWSRAPHTRPVSGATWKPTLRENEGGAVNIGAQ